MQKDADTAAEALAIIAIVLRLRPDISLSWARDNTPLNGQVAKRVRKGSANRGYRSSKAPGNWVSRAGRQPRRRSVRYRPFQTKRPPRSRSYNKSEFFGRGMNLGRH